MLYLIPCDYKKFSSPEEQADHLWKNHLNPKFLPSKTTQVAIVYSANNIQAQGYYASYSSGQVKDIIDPHASNQAKVFLELNNTYITENNAQDQVHILPFATSMRGGKDSDANAVNEDIVKRDVQNVYNHLCQGYEVFLMLQPEEANGSVSQKYQIAGGISVNFNHKYREALEKALNTLANVFPPKGFVTRQEPCFASLEDMITAGWLAEPQIVPQTMAYYVERAYADQDKPKSVSLSPSGRLRIIMNTADKANKLTERLSEDGYEAKILAVAKKEEQDPKKQFPIKDWDYCIVSLPEGEVFKFLKEKLGISLQRIETFYADFITTKCDYSKVEFTRDGIKLDDKDFNFDKDVLKSKQLERKNKFPFFRSGQEQGQIDVMGVKYALQSIITEKNRNAVLLPNLSDSVDFDKRLTK